MDDGKPAAASTVSPKCNRCGEFGHKGENCPHFKSERSDYTDAWTHFDDTPLRETDDGSRWILRDAEELKQPDDGHCLFHSLAVGMRFFAHARSVLLAVTKERKTRNTKHVELELN